MVEQSVKDLKSWYEDGLPVWTGWNKGGFLLKWYNDLIRSGCRVIPPINLLPYDFPEDVTRGCGSPTAFNYFLGPQVAELEWIGQQQIPIILRYGNIAQSFYSTRYRTKPYAENPLVFEINNGQMSATVKTDYLAPVSNWENEGRLIGSSSYVAEIAKRIPSPSHIIHMENHEYGQGPAPNAGGFTNRLSEKPTAWTNDTPPLGIAPDLEFKPIADIARWSARLAERLMTAGPTTPWAEFVVACRKIKAQYDSYYTALFNGFPQGWKARPFITGAYKSGRVRDWQFPKVVTDTVGPSPDAIYVNGSGSEFYIDRYLSEDFTNAKLDKFNNQQRPAWDWEEENDPDSFRLIFTFLDGTGVIKGAKKHPPITPEVWGACITWLLWTNRGANKRAVMINHYTDNAVKPTDPFFTPDQQAQLVAMGRPEMAPLTEGDYATASANAVSSLLDNPILRKFWTEGTPVPVTYTGDVVNVWRSVMKLGDDQMTYEWSPMWNVAGQTKKYSFVRAGKTYTLDEYTALTTKTPFQLWNDSRPDMAEFPLEMRRAIWTYDNPQN